MTLRIGSLLGWLAIIVLMAVWFFAFRPVTLGGSTTWIVIRGSSMEPLYETGDLVVMRATEEYSVGDVVAYRVPRGEIGAGHVVVHRLVGGDPDHGFEVLGDNNDWADPWLPTGADILGSPWIVLPGVGRVIAFLHQPAILGGLAAALVVSFVIAGPSSRQPREKGCAPAPAE